METKKNTLFEDFYNLQSELKPVKKSSDNPFFKSKYADLSTVLESVRELIQKNNFILTQRLTVINDNQALVTELIHKSGESLSSVSLINPEKYTPQAFGSAITYMRRYSLIALLGISTEDDDGNAASKQYSNQQARPSANGKKKACPNCAHDMMVSKYYDGWYCNDKRGGCGNKIYNNPNDDPQAGNQQPSSPQDEYEEYAEVPPF
jgi:hypothetical protein